MKLHRGEVQGYPEGGSVDCAQCKKTSLESHELFYRCDQSDYDQCRACSLVNAKILAERQYFATHKCMMIKYESSRSWWCDTRGLRGKDCLSREVKYTARWRCAACDYDVCLSCAIALSETNIKNYSNLDQLRDQFVFLWNSDGRISAYLHREREFSQAVFELNKSQHKLMILNDEIVGRTGAQKDIDKLIEHARKYSILS